MSLVEMGWQNFQYDAMLSVGIVLIHDLLGVVKEWKCPKRYGESKFDVEFITH